MKYSCAVWTYALNLNLDRKLFFDVLHPNLISNSIVLTPEGCPIMHQGIDYKLTETNGITRVELMGELEFADRVQKILDDEKGK